MATMSEARDRWTAAHCRIARALFETCGAGGATCVDPGASIALTGVAGQFAWHAALLYDLLPERQGVDREALVDVAVGGADAAIALAASDLAGGDEGAGCCVLARVVLPRLRTSVEAALGRVDAVLDGPRARALTLIDRDLIDAIGVLEPVCERLVGDAATLAAATSAMAAAERAIVDDSVAVGIVADRP